MSTYSLSFDSCSELQRNSGIHFGKITTLIFDVRKTRLIFIIVRFSFFLVPSECERKVNVKLGC